MISTLLFSGPRGIGRYVSRDLWEWKSAVALVSLHQFAGMAISYGLHIDPLVLTAAFITTLIPFWCYLTK